MLPVSSGLDHIKAKLLRACEPQQSVLAAWPMVCGGRIAEKSEALTFADGRLTVVVPDKEWKTELSALAGQYCAKLNKLLAVKVDFVLFLTAEEASSRFHAEEGAPSKK